MKLDAQRILIYGVCGSGKTTFARQLSERTGISWTAVDDIAWRPGWVSTSNEQQVAEVTTICAGERWILDSAYAKWADVPLARVELIVGLDYPRWFSLARLLRRTFTRVVDKQKICNGNVETWRQTFSRDSILLWHFRSFTNKRRRMRAWRDAAVAGGPAVILFPSARDTERWLATIDGV
ncbi:MAG TPA: AAA family ATPase [Tepidisphaeraceae bacterium]|jgi:adenylate kinase family enzyme|nr:AAA family ATPase [Tepidisphaeraceae bacterium]